MRMNGLPMTLRTFQSQLRPTEVLDYYESQSHRWGRSEYRRSISGQWALLGIRSADNYISVQARPTITGSEGTITVSASPGNISATTSSGFPHPKTTRILSRQEYEDAGVESEHLSLSSPRAVVVEAQAFIDELTRHGWQIIRRQVMKAASGGIVIEAQHGVQQALLTLQSDRAPAASTAVIVVWKKS